MDYLEDQLEDKALIIQPEEGEVLSFGDSLVILKLTSEQTRDRFGLYQITLGPGAVGAQLHYHRYMDETFMIQSGKVTVQLEDRELIAEAGTVVFVPRFTPHGFRNDTEDQAVITLMFNPGQKREGFFRGLHQVLNQDPMDQNDFLRLYHKYDSFPLEKD